MTGTRTMRVSRGRYVSAGYALSLIHILFIGPPLYDSFRKVVGMTEEQANQAIDHYHERFERVGWAENEVYAGIPSLLRSLKKNGARVAIVTAKPQVFAERIAQKFGFAPYLDDVIGPGMNNKDSSKAALVRRGAEAFGGRVVMVGDRCFDIEGCLLYTSLSAISLTAGRAPI